MPVLSSSSHEVQFELGPHSYLFVYRFGCLAFVNATNHDIDHIISRLKLAIADSKHEACVESFNVRIGGSPLVEFEYIRLPRFSSHSLRVIALVVAQSAALEHFETHTEKVVEQSGGVMRELSKRGLVPFANRPLLKMIGATASARQELLSHLAVLDAPEETWENRALESLHRDLSENFEIEIRSRILEQKLSLIQDNIELLADLASTKRGHLLEALIVALIVLEILIWSIV